MNTLHDNAQIWGRFFFMFFDITLGSLLNRMLIVSYPLWACSEEPHCCQSPWTETRPVPSVHLEACRQEEGYQLVKRHHREIAVRRWGLLKTNGLPLQSPGAWILMILYRKPLRILWKPFSVRFHKSLTTIAYLCTIIQIFMMWKQQLFKADFFCWLSSGQV